ATVRATLRVASGSPIEQIQKAAQALEPDLDRSESFVTLVQAQLDPAGRHLTYVDAGHGNGFFLTSDGALTPLVSGGIPLCGFQVEGYQASHFTFAPGDAFVLYSDGVPDARPDLDLTPPALATYLQGMDSAAAMVERLVSLTATDQPPVDDVTVLVLRCLT
ncbi:MAG: serine/threonine-protein phosphatase, partial [Gloeomargaritaceae cyanobacterium C42_A2020_066]|nr:serine/threonine-protein phosphatase [Gloeomargaritaceae cyanobacterium C42_A2020_066]